MSFWGGLKDMMLGKRYVDGWPRGVRPVFPPSIHINSRMARYYPEKWEQVRRLPAWTALQTLERWGLVRISDDKASVVWIGDPI